MRFGSTSVLVLACAFILPSGIYAKEQTVRTVSIVHRAASSIARDIEAVLDDAVIMHVDGQRIILRGEPKRVSELVRLIAQLDHEINQYTITVLQSSEPISLESHQNLLQIKQYSTDNRQDSHNLQQILVNEDATAEFASDGVSYVVRPASIGQRRVQLKIARQFADSQTRQDLTTTIEVPMGRWIQVGGEREGLTAPVRNFATQKSEQRHSHVYVKVEKIQ